MEAEKKRAGLVRDAKSLREGLDAEINRLQGEVEQLIEREKELKFKFEEVQRKERGKVVKNKGVGKVGILAGLAKQRVEELRVGLEGVVSQKKALETRMAELERILSAFKEEHNPNFNDEGVKRAVKAWENYAANPASGQEHVDEQDIESILKPDTETEGINWAEWESGAEEESDVEARKSSTSVLTLRR